VTDWNLDSRPWSLSGPATSMRTPGGMKVESQLQSTPIDDRDDLRRLVLPCPGCGYNVVIQAVEGIRQHRSLDKMALDLNNSVSETYGRREPSTSPAARKGMRWSHAVDRGRVHRPVRRFSRENRLCGVIKSLYHLILKMVIYGMFRCS